MSARETLAKPGDEQCNEQTAHNRHGVNRVVHANATPLSGAGGEVPFVA